MLPVRYNSMVITGKEAEEAEEEEEKQKYNDRLTDSVATSMIT